MMRTQSTWLSKCSLLASLVTQVVKRLPAMWETWVRPLGLEDPLEKEMATHSSTLAWKIPWMEETGMLQSMGSQSQTQRTCSLSLSLSLSPRAVHPMGLDKWIMTYIYYYSIIQTNFTC